MKIRTLLIGAAILTVVGIPLGLLTTGGLTGGGEAAAMSSSPPAQVDVAPVLIKRVQRWDEYNGRISAVGSVEMRSRVSGYVTHVAYREGDEVRRGDVLFTIDPRPYEAALNSAAAQLQRARATALLAKSRDERARRLLPSSAVSQDETLAMQPTHKARPTCSMQKLQSS
jgi:multidrug efflux system membrane fusion protein